VDAKGVGVQWHFGAVSGNDFPLHDAYGLLGGFGGIVNERVGVLSRAQRAVGFVAAVGEGFGTNASQDSTDVVFNALEHKQVWRCEQLLLLLQQGAGRVPINAFKSNLVARAKLPQAV
jgi:hypothetical protein